MQDEPEERAGGKAPAYETFVLTWKGQALILRWCVQWLGSETAHLEIVTEDRRPHPLATGSANLAKLDGLGSHMSDVVESHRMRDILNQIKDVVETGNQMVDFFAVERRNERRVQLPHGFVGNAISALLDRIDNIALPGCFFFGII